MTETDIWLLRYEHEHGVDLSFYPSEGIAQLHAVNLILDWMGDVDNLEGVGQILDLIQEKSYFKAVDLYNKLMAGKEAVVVECVEVDYDDISEELQAQIESKTDRERSVLYDVMNDPELIREEIEREAAILGPADTDESKGITADMVKS